MNKILIFACFVNGLLLCSSGFHYVCWLIIVLFYQYKTHYFNKTYVIFFLFFFLLSQNTWTYQNNQIIEAKENYAIAAIDHKKVLVYSDVPLFEKDQITVTGELQDIHSTSNFNLFHFETMMKQKKITKMLQKDAFEIIPKNSLRRKVYERIESYNESTQIFLKKILYNYENEEKALLYSSGLHLSYLNQLIFGLIAPLSKVGASLVSILAMLGLGAIFPVHYAMKRIVIFNLCRLFFPEKSTKDRLGITMLGCMFITPSCVFELGYIIPISLQFVSCFNCKKVNQSWLSRLLLVFMNFYYFGEVNLFEIAFFPVFRKIHTYLFLIGLLVLLIPSFSFLTSISLFVYLLEDIPSLSFTGKPTMMLSLFFLVCYGFAFSFGKSKSMLMCVLTLCLIPLQSYINPFYEVTFINVGQGDCILLKAPFNQNHILIDIPSAKNQNIAEKIVVPYLHSLGIHSIDTLILTHDDLDHAGGVEELKALIEVKNIHRSHEDVPFGSVVLQSLNQPHLDENEDSLVYYLNIHGLSYLFMGDATKKVEKEIIEHYPTLQADIIKIGHHGSQTSTDSLFLQQLQSRLAVISAGWHNFYGHPHQETLDTLTKYHVPYHLTYEKGAIKIKSFLNLNFVLTSSSDFGIIISNWR